MAERSWRSTVTPVRPDAIGSGQSVGRLVAEIAARLGAAECGIEDPVREARDLLAALLDVPRHWPILKENRWADSAVWQRARRAAAKRASGAPLAYAVGKASFRDLTLTVDERVLIPRPETELLVDLVLARCGTAGGVVVDVGTGSGAIAIALAREGSFDRVLAIDISTDALEVARANAATIGARVEFGCGDLLTAYDMLHAPTEEAARDGAGRTSDVGPRTSGAVRSLRVVVSNPPYISFEEIRQLPASVRDWEPALALLSPREGLATTARLVRQAATRLAPGGLLALEVDARRAALVAEMLSGDVRFGHVAVHLDLAGRERFVLATRGEEKEQR